MIANLQPYQEYKESGSPWLGRMPKHWGLVRLGSVLRERRETNEEKKVEQVLSVLKDVGVIRYEDKGNIGNKKSEDIGRYKIVRPDDIVVNCMNVIIGSVGRSRYTGCLSPVYYVLTRRSEADNPRYLAAIFSTKPFHESLVRIGNGILAHRMRIPMELLKCEPFPVPPAGEQAAMVRFLDWANGRLERAIRAKRQVIALLHEQKQAIIHRAVTGKDEVRMRKDENGNSSFTLQPSALPKKPSGIPWLGDIPQHWEVSRVKNEFRCLNTQRIPLNSVERGEMTSRLYDYYGASGVIDKVDDYLFDDELLLIAEDGANLVLRNLPLAIIARGKFWVNNHAHILKPKRGNLVYLANYMETLNYIPWISGAAQPKLTQDRFLSISIAVAPSEEQDAIVEHTARETQPLLNAIARLEREIGLLREYRTRLVADVVTGKLDVRAAARQLPAEPEAPAAPVAPDELTDETEVETEEAEA